MNSALRSPNGGGNQGGSQGRATPGVPRVREFNLGDMRVEGDVSPPAIHEQHLPRKFKRVDSDGNGQQVNLYWCWTCNGGMWKKHSTDRCPSRRRSPSPRRNNPNDSTSTQDASSSSDGRRVSFATMAALNRSREMNRPSRANRDASRSRSPGV